MSWDHRRPSIDDEPRERLGLARIFILGAQFLLCVLIAAALVAAVVWFAGLL